MLLGKIALVTGGASGIGRATSLVFAREGAKVAVVDRDEEGGNRIVETIRKNGGNATFIPADLSKSGDVADMVKTTLNVYSRIDCAFNNAGISGTEAGAHGETHEIPEEAWDRMMRVNLKGTWLCMKYEIIQMLVQGGGVIVNTSSALGLVGQPGTSAYVASKHGIVGLTRSAALEYATRNIRINAVCPGLIDTAGARRKRTDPDYHKKLITRMPIGRLGQPEEVAEAVAWLCSNAASFVVGHTLCVDGAWTAQ